MHPVVSKIFQVTYKRGEDIMYTQSEDVMTLLHGYIMHTSFRFFKDTIYYKCCQCTQVCTYVYTLTLATLQIKHFKVYSGVV